MKPHLRRTHSEMQNMMDGQHQHQFPALQQQHQNHGHHQQAATSESDAHLNELLMESKSGSDNMEGGGGRSGSAGEELQEEDRSLQRPRKKCYRRHTQHQIQELEAYVQLQPSL